MKVGNKTLKPYVEYIERVQRDGLDSINVRRVPVEKAIKRAKKAARAAGNAPFRNDEKALDWYIEWKGGTLVK